MLSNQRIIHNNNGTLLDLSRALNDITSLSGTVDLALTDDYLYVGSDLPFNHRYFQVSTANAVSSTMSVDIWDGSSWVAAVDVMDQTSTAGATLAASGIISWTLARTASWGQEATTEDITGMTTLKIYDFYWARLKVSASLTGTTALSYVGHKFARDEDLGVYYPDLIQSAVIDAFSTGKTNWNDQHVYAAEEIIRDIRQKKIVWSRNQVLDWEQFNIAAVHKVAANIMMSFGDDFREKRAIALQEYQKAMNLKIFLVDKNEDGRVDEDERRLDAGIYRS